MAAQVNRLVKSKDCPTGRFRRSRWRGDKTYVGTPLGVAEFDGGRFSRVLGSGLLVTSLFVSGEDLLVGTEDQGVVRIPLTARRTGLNPQASTQLAEVQQFLGTEGWNGASGQGWAFL